MISLTLALINSPHSLEVNKTKGAPCHLETRSPEDFLMVENFAFFFVRVRDARPWKQVVTMETMLCHNKSVVVNLAFGITVRAAVIESYSLF